MTGCRAVVGRFERGEDLGGRKDEWRRLWFRRQAAHVAPWVLCSHGVQHGVGGIGRPEGVSTQGETDGPCAESLLQQLLYFPQDAHVAFFLRSPLFGRQRCVLLGQNGDRVTMHNGRGIDGDGQGRGRVGQACVWARVRCFVAAVVTTAVGRLVVGSGVRCISGGAFSALLLVLVAAAEFVCFFPLYGLVDLFGDMHIGRFVMRGRDSENVRQLGVHVQHVSGDRRPVAGFDGVEHLHKRRAHVIDGGYHRVGRDLICDFRSFLQAFVLERGRCAHWTVGQAVIEA